MLIRGWIMKISHEKIDYVASALLLFNSVVLLAVLAQRLVSYLFALHYSDYALVSVSILIALLATHKSSITTVSRIIHALFRLDI